MLLSRASLHFNVPRDEWARGNYLDSLQVLNNSELSRYRDYPASFPQSALQLVEVRLTT